jgi:tetratricopeptide (TPR) repeat protein
MRLYIILSFAATLFLACTSEKKKAIEHYLKAKEFLKKDDIKNAASQIEMAIALDSSNLDFQITKAHIITKTDNYEEAIKILEGLSLRKFKSDTVNFYIGSCYFNSGNQFITHKYDKDKATEYHEKALTYYNKTIDLNIQYFDAYVSKQMVLHNLNRYDDALVVLNSAINIFPDSISLICYRGIEKIYLGDLTGAMTDLNNSIQSNKLDSISLASAYRFRGNLFFKKDNVDEAINDLTNAFKYNPKDAYILFTRGNCYKEKGLKDKACEDYRKAADLGFVRLYKNIKEYCTD